MAKTTIYVPDDLRERMNAHPDENWSAVAQRAFDGHLDQLTSRMRVRNMTDLVERLRASKNAHLESEQVVGKEAGRTWATNSAEYQELARLVAVPFDAWNDNDLSYNVGKGITGANDDNEGYSEINDFWELRAGTCEPSDEFVEGFCDGALEVWNEVADKV